MVCKTPKELLLEIKKYMLSNNIMIKDLAFKMNASQSNIGKILTVIILDYQPCTKYVML